MKLFKFSAAAAAALLLMSVSAQAQVTVTTGGGYVKMVEALANQYEADTGVKVERAFGGNIGQMLAQVEKGSPVTVVISDATSLKKFTKALDETRAAPLGRTPLVLAWKKGLELKSPEDLKAKNVERVAMPDPKAAVYGRAAQEYLASSGLADALKAKLNVVSMVPQVLSYLTRGEMDAGFVNLLAARQGKQKLGGFMTIDSGYEPIRMTAMPVKGVAGEAQDVKAFLEYLSSSKADAVLEKFGVMRAAE